METTSLNKTVWCIDPLLGRDLETNETTAISYAMAQLTHLYNNRIIFGNGVMQPVPR
jgi:hypothetical protein